MIYLERGYVMIRIELDEKARRQLRNIRRKTDDPRGERALAVLLSDEGKSPPEIAGHLHRHYNTVRDWLHRFQEEGIEGLQRRYSPGRPSKRKALLIPVIEECLSRLPSDYGYSEPYWSTALIRDLCRRRTGRDFSTDSVERALHDAGFSYKRPRKGVPANAPSKTEKRKEVLRAIEEIGEILSREDAEVYAVDETHLSTQPYVIRGWHRRGKPFFPQDRSGTSGLHRVWCICDGDKTFLLEERRD